ncbi:acyltransferase [Butyrivibrio sp. INlla21]|uniref:acyltransferase n=1 Tax=Butyrivibrio sp. INlla21 TaxID=1520811 RepID=UPI0008E2F3F9|nr:acyltransferase [Butyrivibrio sp. INlla21]SFV02761.1 transferase hexapeptide (six repeat-containing protein) [Butyrivibrio sp. INlla21]
MKIISLFRRIELWETNRRIHKIAKTIGVRFINNDPKSCINCNTSIGDDVSFNGMRIIGSGNVSIGSHFHCGENCYIISDNHNYDAGNEIPYDRKGSIPKNIVIEPNVWIGTGVIVLGDAHIGEGAIIQAGSVVVGDIPAGGIAGGHPAKVFKYRDRKHYEELKEKNAYILNK